ncbi:hypothetical protein N566_17400, partial [Streptomycetaceae bacterium MP113-05]
ESVGAIVLPASHESDAERVAEDDGDAPKAVKVAKKAARSAAKKATAKKTGTAKKATAKKSPAKKAASGEKAAPGEKKAPSRRTAAADQQKPQSVSAQTDD